MSSRQEKRRRRAALVIHAPGDWVEQVECASLRDRAYFELHPEKSFYVRRRIRGEFGPREAWAEREGFRYVYVRQLWPGARVREPMHLVRPSDYPAGKVPFEHVEAMWEHCKGELFTVKDGDIDDTPVEGGDVV